MDQGRQTRHGNVDRVNSMIQVTSQQSNNVEIIKMDCHLKGKINPQVMKSEKFFPMVKVPWNADQKPSSCKQICEQEKWKNLHISNYYKRISCYH
jgi:hypothetical protein